MTSPGRIFTEGVKNGREEAIEKIKQHIPSLSREDEQTVFDRAVDVCHGFEETGADTADLALRTCACGVKIDGYYSFIDHLIEVFGGESHLAG